MWQGHDLDLGSPILCLSSLLLWGQQRETTVKCLWWPVWSVRPPTCVHLFSRNGSARPWEKSAHLGLERWLGFLSADDHQTSVWNGIITVISYRLGHGSISFHGRESLMVSLQYVPMLSVLQLSTVKSRITRTKILKSVIAFNNKENTSVNYIHLHKYLNGCIRFAVDVNLYSFCFKNSTAHTNDLSRVSSNKINVD